MTERERYLETLLFGRPDRIPLVPGGPRESTLAAWRTQGLPEGVHYYEHLLELLGVEPPPKIDRLRPGVSFRMMPEFEEKVIERREGRLIVQDWKGNICEMSDKFDVRYLHRRAPIRARDDVLLAGVRLPSAGAHPAPLHP